MVLDPRSLPPARKRLFVPKEADLGEWTQGEHLFTELQTRPIGSRSDMEVWVRDYSELLGVIAEEGAIRYIRMTEQTDDETYRKAHLRFVEDVAPNAKRAVFNLNRKFASSRFARELPDERYRMMRRRVENSIALYRGENVDLEKEEEKLGQEYEMITGTMTVSYDGRERTMSELARYFEVQDGKKREEVWRLLQARRKVDREKIDRVYEKMLGIRHLIAANAGFKNYREYAFLKRERFDYTPDDCLRFHDAVEKYIVPLARRVQQRRQECMDVEVLRPWDMFVDDEGRPPLRPFESSEEFTRKARETLAHVDPSLGDHFQAMARMGLLDIASRPGKAPGGYNAELSDRVLPFTFMNSVGRDQDMWTLFHESGHAFHVFEMRDKELPYYYRGDNIPSEMAEVASMGMELLAGEHIEGTFYGSRDASRSLREHLRTIVNLLPWVATVDSFQHWVYTHPGHTLDERLDAWVRVDDRFNVGEDWAGLDEFRRYQWHRQLHIFLIPFYYFEYGVAQLGALGVWSRYRRDPTEAVETYRRALSLGSSEPLPELFRQAGVPWDLGESMVERYARELEKLLLS